jgi:hypothetical protein
METTLKIRPDWVHLHFEGRGTPEELKVAFSEAVKAAESASVPRIMIDSRESTVHPGFDAMRDLATFVLSLRRSNLPRTALIVRGSFQYGLARMFGSLVEFSDWEFRIFRDTEAAERWLIEEEAKSP